MTIILSYIVAFITTMLVTNLVYLSIIIFKPLTDRFPFLMPVSHFVVSVSGAVTAVYAYVLIAEKTFLTVSYFMILLPTLFMLANNINRVSKAKKGISGVRRIMELRDEGHLYNQRIDILNEQFSEVGFSAGFLIGMAFFIGKAGFFS